MNIASEAILLAVTGLTPQVVTETLYGIYQKGLEWPTQIKILTTKKGHEQARLNLLVNQQLDKLCNEYGLPRPAFTESDIEIIPDANGNLVDDARTEEDQSALASYITRRVGELTADPNTRLHASIAGGRKTMTFFLGYAMSIFGRPLDRLSHVLVSAEYESCSDFYFPTKETQVIRDRNDKQLDSSKGIVTLAEIPFISQRHQFNDKQVSEFLKLDYNELISYIKLAQQPNNITITFIYNKKEPTVLVNDTPISFRGKLFEFSLFSMLARSVADNTHISRPNDAEQFIAFNTKLFYEFSCFDTEWKAPNDKNSFDRFIDLIDCESLITREETDALKDGEYGMSGCRRDFYQSKKNILKNYIETKIPKTLANIIGPQNQYGKEKKHLQLQPQQIFFRPFDG